MLQKFRLVFGLVATAALSLIGLDCAVAQAPQSAGRLPGEPCRIEPLATWTEQEQWVWRTVCEGKTANLAERFGGSWDPSKAQEWPDRRTLTPIFLETILLHEPFRLALTRRGVRIEGARIKELLDLNGARVSHELWLNKSYLENGVDLTNTHFTDRLAFDGTGSAAKFDLAGVRVDKELAMRNAKLGFVDLTDAKVGENLLMARATFGKIYLYNAKVTGRLDIGEATLEGKLDMNSLQVGDLFLGKGNFADIVLRNAKVAGQLEINTSAAVSGKLDMNSLQVGANLLLNDSDFAGDVDLVHTKVRGVVNLNGSTFAGKLSLDLLQVDGSLFMNRGSLGEVNFQSTKVGGQISMSGSHVTGKLTMGNVEAGRGLMMNDAAKFRDIAINAARISDHLGMEGAEFAGEIKIEGLKLKGNALLRNSKFLERVTIILSTIEGSLTLEASELGWLDLSGTTITGEFTLAVGESVRWQGKSTLILRNTVVGTVADSNECWPGDLTVVLGGFTYQRWGGLFGVPSENAIRFTTHPAQWFASSLAKDPSYSPQPYEQLSKVLRTMGYAAYADDILYEGKTRALLEEPAPWYSKVSHTVLLAVIGFGHRLWYAVIWTIFFIAVGTLVVTRTTEGKHEGIRFALAYSVETLLPLVKLREKFSAIDFEGSWRPARYYFYFHRVMGYVLATFLIAALSGLTK